MFYVYCEWQMSSLAFSLYAKLSYYQHYQNIFFSLCGYVCCLDIFCPFSFLPVIFFGTFGFRKKKYFFAVLLLDCLCRHYSCYQLLLWMLFTSVGLSVDWLSFCICVCMCFFYLFIEFNSFTVGCWQTHFQIANNVQFSRFITFCGNKTNWIICALLCFERISVSTYICIHAAVCIGFLDPHSVSLIPIFCNWVNEPNTHICTYTYTYSVHCI